MVEKLVKQVGPKNGPNLQFVGFFEAAKYGTQAAGGSELWHFNKVIISI